MQWRCMLLFLRLLRLLHQPWHSPLPCSLSIRLHLSAPLSYYQPDRFPCLLSIVPHLSLLPSRLRSCFFLSFQLFALFLLQHLWHPSLFLLFSRQPLCLSFLPCLVCLWLPLWYFLWYFLLFLWRMVSLRPWLPPWSCLSHPWRLLWPFLSCP